MALKPQDVYVALKIVAAKLQRASYSRLAEELVMSPSEVHASVKRAQLAHLLHGAKMHDRPNLGALEEFLVHGLKYVFPAERGELTRGVPTSYAAEPLRSALHKTTNLPRFGLTRRASGVASHLSRCTRLHRSQPCAILHFTSTSSWPMPFATAESANESTQSKSCTDDFERRMSDSNLDQLIEAAEALRPLLGELVFVGGCVTGLLTTDEGAAAPRPTLDVDAIAEIASYAEYAKFGERLRGLGFREDSSEGAPLCRWVYQHTILDVMPLEEKILGFSNRWYKAAMKSSTTKRISPGS